MPQPSPNFIARRIQARRDRCEYLFVKMQNAAGENPEQAEAYLDRLECHLLKLLDDIAREQAEDKTVGCKICGSPVPLKRVYGVGFFCPKCGAGFYSAKGREWQA